MSKRIAVIGASGRGKSSYIKDFILGIPPENILINDVNGEYGGKYFPRAEFLKMANKRLSSIIIFEEATMFFRGKSVDEMIELLVRTRHMKKQGSDVGNTIILVFHSLRSVPPDIFDFIDHWVLFPTEERSDIVHSRYKNEPDIFEAWSELRERESEITEPHFHNGKPCFFLHEFIEI